jgi:multidrug efflux system outer membrane protein
VSTLLMLGALGAAGCVMGPNYQRPAVNVPRVYRGMPAGEADTAGDKSLGDQRWWDVFQDDTVQQLIRTALQQNYDLRIAAVRVLEARARLGITRADQYPNVGAGTAVVNERSPGSPMSETTIGQVSASIAWNLDFWGHFRRATEAARASLLANEWARREVVSALVSDVASAYFALRALDLELEISRQTLESRQGSLRLTQMLADRGATSLLDVRQAEQLVFGAAASIPDLEQRIEQQENVISLLLGTNPQAVPRGWSLTEQPQPPELPAGLPSALLERRPDIRQAEQQLVAVNANIGVAKADLFPQIAVTGSGGLQSVALASLFSGSAGFWAVGASAAQSVFDGGRIRNRVRLAEAQQQEAALVYQRTIQQAFRDVADALIAYRKTREFRVQQEQLTRAAEDATRLSTLRYQGGATSYLEVLDSDTRKFAAQLNLVQAQHDELQSVVRTYRALGGGW